MSDWERFDIEARVLAILADVPQHDPSHHFGRPFLTAYQLAIEFETRYPEEAATIGPVGGEGIGRHTSLSQCLARELSRRIRSGELWQVEGRFLSSQHLNDISFFPPPSTIHSSLTKSQYDLSMFRSTDQDP